MYLTLALIMYSTTLQLQPQGGTQRNAEEQEEVEVEGGGEEKKTSPAARWRHSSLLCAVVYVGLAWQPRLRKPNRNCVSHLPFLG